MNKTPHKAHNPPSDAKKRTTLYPNGILSSEATYVNNTRHGISTWWYDSGQKRLESMWRDGKKHGMEIGWHESGAKALVVMWRDGAPYGMETGRHENGKKWREMMWADNDIYANIVWDEKGDVTSVTLPISTPVLVPAHFSKNHTNAKI